MLASTMGEERTRNQQVVDEMRSDISSRQRELATAQAETGPRGALGPAEEARLIRVSTASVAAAQPDTSDAERIHHLLGE